MPMDLNDETRDRIAKHMDAGFYRTPDHVLTVALDLLDKYEEAHAEKLADLRGLIRAGIESGPAAPMDWDDFWKRADARVNERKTENAASR